MTPVSRISLALPSSSLVYRFSPTSFSVVNITLNSGIYPVSSPHFCRHLEIKSTISLQISILLDPDPSDEGAMEAYEASDLNHSLLVGKLVDDGVVFTDSFDSAIDGFDGFDVL